MGNKRTKTKKPKQQPKMAGKKGGRVEVADIGSPTPVRKQKKK